MKPISQRRSRMGRTQAGLNLIEVMVAVVVLSIGLLGMGTLMGMSVRNTQSANFRTQATNLAYDYIDLVRANISNMGRYTIGWTVPATVCAAAEVPTVHTTCGNTHACDLARWGRELCHTLPNGRGRANIVRGAGRDVDITVDICWSDDRSVVGAAPSTDCTNASETLFRVTSGL